jgi:DNA polymerase/3'-5' exonuclease PolX
MDNKTIATMLYETADLMEIDGADPFRIRSYRNAAEAIDGWPEQIAQVACEPKKLLEIPGIGKAMQANLLEICNTGQLTPQQELLTKYRPTMLELLKISGLGPKTIQLIWSAYQVADVDGVERLAKEGKLRELPRLSEKTEQKILKSIETYRSISGRFLIDNADTTAEKLIEHIKPVQGVEKITPAGSLRRGRETVGDLDILITGTACEDPAQLAALGDHVLKFPGILEVLVKGENKVSFRLRSGMQVDVRLLPRDSFGAAMQYFTGSKTHNVSLRQRAIRMGYTLNEYGLAKLEEDGTAGRIVASKTEEDIYKKLKLAYIPPEMRENCGEIEVAEKNEIPSLVTVGDIQGDVHMHTVETDGKCTIEEMAIAARGRGYRYMAITDHTKNLAMANGRTRSSAHRAHSRGEQESRWHQDLRRGRSRYSRRRRSGSLRRSARADGHRHRQRPFALQPGSLPDDRAHPQGHRESEHVPHRARHRTPAAAPRRLQTGHGRDPQGRRETSCRDGTQLLPRPPRPQRPAPAHGQAARREDRHQHRLAPHVAHAVHQVRRATGAARVADERRRSEYSARRQVREGNQTWMVNREDAHLQFILGARVLLLFFGADRQCAACPAAFPRPQHRMFLRFHRRSAQACR